MTDDCPEEDKPYRMRFEYEDGRVEYLTAAEVIERFGVKTVKLMLEGCVLAKKCGGTWFVDDEAEDAEWKQRGTA